MDREHVGIRSMPSPLALLPSTHLIVRQITRRFILDRTTTQAFVAPGKNEKNKKEKREPKRAEAMRCAWVILVRAGLPLPPSSLPSKVDKSLFSICNKQAFLSVFFEEMGGLFSMKRLGGWVRSNSLQMEVPREGEAVTHKSMFLFFKRHSSLS